MDRRKTGLILARWRDACAAQATPPGATEAETMPSWEHHAAVIGDLDIFCMSGHFSPGRTEAITGRIGAFFLDSLETGRGTDPTDAYCAAVVMGIVRSLATQLLHDAAPVLHDGEFRTKAGGVARFRTAVLPFGDPGQGPDRWLALSGWRVVALGSVPRAG